MKKLFIVCFLLCLSKTAVVFAQETMTPVDLNNKFMDITDSLYTLGGKWGDALKEALDTDNYKLLTPIRKEAEKFLQQKKIFLQAFKDQYGSEGLRMALIDFLDYEKDIISKGFKPFEELNESSKEEERKELSDNLTELVKDEDSKMKTIEIEQEKFAAKNNFTIEPPPEEEE